MNIQTILYVEDEENDVFLMRQAWKKAGLVNPFQVVSDGEQAVEYLSGQGKYANRADYPLPCLLLLDLKLPKLSGLDVLKWIRRQPVIHTLPVIALSSSNNPRDICAVYELRANAYLVKPHRIEDLVKLVASLKDFWLDRAEIPPECSKYSGVPS